MSGMRQEDESAPSWVDPLPGWIVNTAGSMPIEATRVWVAERLEEHYGHNADLAIRWIYRTSVLDR